MDRKRSSNSQKLETSNTSWLKRLSGSRISRTSVTKSSKFRKARQKRLSICLKICSWLSTWRSMTMSGSRSLAINAVSQTRKTTIGWASVSRRNSCLKTWRLRWLLYRKKLSLRLIYATVTFIDLATKRARKYGTAMVTEPMITCYWTTGLLSQATSTTALESDWGWILIWRRRSRSNTYSLSSKGTTTFKLSSSRWTR